MFLEWKNLNQSKSFVQLCQNRKGVEPQEALNKERLAQWIVPAGGGWDFHYAASLLTEKTLGQLQALADEQQLLAKYQYLLQGERVNSGENRRVLHHLSRGQQGSDVIEQEENIRSFYEEQRQRIADFSQKVHSGEILGSTGKKIDTVVQIGIGGSDLGPRALYLALCQAYESKLKAFFISNVDPDDTAQVIREINPETSLFILVSKSGTTQETLANYGLVLRYIEKAAIKGFNPAQHTVAVTSRSSPLAHSGDVLDAFYIDDNIGGRYSSTSAVGGTLLSLTLGPDIFHSFLLGAAEADALAKNTVIQENAALLDALIGVFYRNVMGFSATAILPYSQALSRFPAHLQQLDMESNGKSVNRYGEPIPYATGPIVFGEPGTNGQHSFYQLLHQGSDRVSLQFIGLREGQTSLDLEQEGSTNQEKLKANLAAQIVAFVKGERQKNPNKNFQGGRPATLLVADKIEAKTLGSLLAHYENKVMFQGFCWNINSFDQEGVQLGKRLTQALLDGTSHDEALAGYARILDLKERVGP